RFPTGEPASPSLATSASETWERPLLTRWVIARRLPLQGEAGIVPTPSRLGKAARVPQRHAFTDRQEDAVKRIILVFALLVSCAVFASGCYVATVDMRKPEGAVHVQKFASCWVYGLVPPPTVDAAALCPNGISKVETQHSFLNYLVGGLTFGIYTPIQIK